MTYAGVEVRSFVADHQRDGLVAGQHDTAAGGQEVVLQHIGMDTPPPRCVSANGGVTALVGTSSVGWECKEGHPHQLMQPLVFAHLMKVAAVGVADNDATSAPCTAYLSLPS